MRSGRGQIIVEDFVGRLQLGGSHFVRSEAAARKVNARLVPSAHAPSANAPAHKHQKRLFNYRS